MKKYVSAHTLMSQAMEEKIDRVVEQHSERLRKKIHANQRGLEEWVF